VETTKSSKETSLSHIISADLSTANSSRTADRKNPVKFRVGAHEVISCWDMGFEGLKQGATADLICPPNYAYGKFRRGSIPPRTPVLFTIEVIGIEP